MHHRNKYYSKLYLNGKQLFGFLIIFHSISVFTVFLIKYSRRDYFQKRLKILDTKLLTVLFSGFKCIELPL